MQGMHFALSNLPTKGKRANSGHLSKLTLHQVYYKERISGAVEQYFFMLHLWRRSSANSVHCGSSYPKHCPDFDLLTVSKMACKQHRITIMQTILTRCFTTGRNCVINTHRLSIIWWCALLLRCMNVTYSNWWCLWHSGLAIRYFALKAVSLLCTDLKKLFWNGDLTMGNKAKTCSSGVKICCLAWQSYYFTE